MFLEVFILLSTVFFVSVWLYKQRRSSVEILQLEFSNSTASLHELVEEHQPLVIRGTPFPPSLTRTKLQQIPRLAQFPLRGEEPNSPTFGAYLASPSQVLPDEQTYGIPLLQREASVSLATELALDRWVGLTLGPFLEEFMGIFPPLYTLRTSVLLGGMGLRRPPALYTCILPTEGTYTVSLVNQRSESFLPKVWNYRYPQSFTINDTPLVGEIQFIDVVVRPGTLLAIPAHLLYSIQPKTTSDFHSAVVIEIHSPISTLAAVTEN